MQFREFFEYEQEGGGRPISDWRSSLSVKEQAHLDSKIEYAESSEITRSDLVKDVKGYKGLYEFRTSIQRKKLRILLCKLDDGSVDFVMLVGIVKKTAKLKSSDLKAAVSRAALVKGNKSRAKHRTW